MGGQRVTDLMLQSIAKTERRMPYKRPNRYVPPVEQPYIGVTTTAAMLGVSRQRVFAMIKQGHFKSAYMADDAWLILRSEVEKFIQSRE